MLNGDCTTTSLQLSREQQSCNQELLSGLHVSGHDDAERQSVVVPFQSGLSHAGGAAHHSILAESTFDWLGASRTRCWRQVSSPRDTLLLEN